LPFTILFAPPPFLLFAGGVLRAPLLGTRFTMEHDFYKGRLSGFDVLIPEEPARTRVHDIIYQELVLGQINEASRDEYRRIMGGLMERGAEGIILGCTEIPLLVKPEDASVPLFDTTLLHAQAAVDFALSGSAG
ncbi:MAG: aspartate/glutamate racemase family protein, partial [Anaerolineae bacterium]